MQHIKNTTLVYILIKFKLLSSLSYSAHICNFLEIGGSWKLRTGSHFPFLKFFAMVNIMLLFRPSTFINYCISILQNNQTLLFHIRIPLLYTFHIVKLIESLLYHSCAYTIILIRLHWKPTIITKPYNFSHTFISTISFVSYWFL
jgi:hypothetical protein